MARPAPAVQRTMRLLKHLSLHPRDRFSLSELARDLDMNKATVHAMLATLVDEGALIRHPSDKSYTLGPALVSLGAAASIDAHQALEIAMPEMAAINDCLDVSVVATTLIGWEIVILGRRDADRPIAGYVPVGHRMPIAPPQGREFLAWASERTVTEWIDRTPGVVTPERRQRWFSLLDEARRMGYVISTPEVTDLQRVLASLTEMSGVEKLQDQLHDLITDIDPGVTVEAGSEPSVLANAVISPVFGPEGEVLLCLAISGFAPGTTPLDIARFTKRLVSGTERVTRLLHGCEVEPDWIGKVETGAG